MKKIKLAVAALVIAAGIFGAFAFNNANETTTEADTTVTTLHWFDSETGAYLGVDTETNIQINHCGQAGPKDCADGYEQIDGSGEPVGSRVAFTTKQ